MRNESASIVMIAGTECDGNNVRKLANERSDLTRLRQPGLAVEHVEEITGNTNEVKVRSLFDQPLKPLKAEMKVGGKKEFHGFGKCFIQDRRKVIRCADDSRSSTSRLPDGLNGVRSHSFSRTRTVRCLTDRTEIYREA
jgi:hypothetical protein